MATKYKDNKLKKDQIHACDGACENRVLIDEIIQELLKYKKILGLE